MDRRDRLQSGYWLVDTPNREHGWAHYVLAIWSHAAFRSLLVQSVFRLLVQDGDTLTRLISLGFNDTIVTLLRTKWQNKVEHNTHDERRTQRV